MTTTHERILILDFGSQVTQLIARRVREAGVYCEVRPFHMTLGEIQAFQPKGIILSGGPSSVYDGNAPSIDQGVFDLGLPIFGICYGEQLICNLLGGRVTGGGTGEFGRADLTVASDNALFQGVWSQGQAYPVWMSHGDKVDRIPEGFLVTATSPGAPYAAIAHEQKRIYAVQFHPEVAHTPDGAKLLSNFVHAICGCTGDWSMKGFRDEEIARIRAKVGTDRVICGVSGGVDSLVAAKLIHEAIGEQLTCIFVNTGLLRLGEAEQVQTSFRDHYHIPLIYVDASTVFLDQLRGVSDPETKRKIIGKLFVDVFDAESEKIADAKWLAQGTLYPDVIESVSISGGPSHVIKSHHNVGGLPENMKLGLVEPLRELFKDEVRKLGLELGLPHAMVYRHPFPGPGLAIRIPGEITRERVAILQKADAIYIDELRKNDLYDKIWQAFAVLLPVNTVGVMGDARTYEAVCALRAVTSTDGMTADVFPFPHETLLKISNRIVNEVRGINRVTYDVTSKPPATIEWE